jgi:O-succinylbenzoate synthase
VRNPLTLNPDSTLTVPTGPGNGAEVDWDYLDQMTLARWELKA